MFNIAEAIMAIGFFGSVMVIARSIAMVWTKRMELRKESLSNSAVEKRLASIETAVDAIALEVERISEAQRYALRQAESRPTERIPGPRTPAEGRIVTPH